jgi:uncharacterized delta-60 repeat protein
MPISRPFAYNPTLQTEGVSQQYGTLAVGFSGQSYQNQGGLRWWNGPDEELGYVIGTSVPSGGPIAPDGTTSTVGFWRTSGFVPSEFVNLSNTILGVNLQSPSELITSLNSNGYFTSAETNKLIFVGGNLTSYQGVSSSRIARLNTDGSYDSTFNIQSGFSPNVLSTFVQSDGKILVGGSFINYNQIQTLYLTRLNTDGTRDSSFNYGDNSNNSFDSSITDISVQPDGKILVGGTFTSYSGISVNRLARLNTDGSYDSTFNIGSGFNDEVRTIALQPDGKIIVGGYFVDFNGLGSDSIVRLNTDGTFDTGSPNFIPNDNVETIALQTDGKILVGGWFFSPTQRIARLNTDLSFDSTFVDTGLGFDDRVLSIKVQPDGKILVGGRFISYSGTSVVDSNRIIRLNTDGSNDSTFNIGNGFSSTVDRIDLQSDEKILVRGSYLSFNGVAGTGITRLNTDGSLDTSFSNLGVNSTLVVSYSSIQSDGKIIIGGSFDISNLIPSARLMSLNTDATYNFNFNIGTGVNGTVTDLVQIESQILAVGAFSTYRGNTTRRIVKLNLDGSRDDLFNSGVGTIGFDGNCLSVKIQNDGKILVGGSFSNYQEVPINRIIRLNTDASYDSTFNIGTGFNGSVNSLVLQSDGKVVAGGLFGLYSGISSNRIARLNTNGLYDSTFNIGTGFDANVNTLSIQSDNKILVGGTFTNYQGVSRNRIVRLNTDGSYDLTFNIGTGTPAVINNIALQTDGKILIGGSFGSYSGITSNRIARLNTNGSYDTSFNIGTGFNFTVENIFVQSDGKILVGGQFTAYQGVSRNRIVRLNTDGSYDSTFDIGLGIPLTAFVVKEFDILSTN